MPFPVCHRRTFIKEVDPKRVYYLSMVCVGSGLPACHLSAWSECMDAMFRCRCRAAGAITHPPARATWPVCRSF